MLTISASKINRIGVAHYTPVPSLASSDSSIRRETTSEKDSPNLPLFLSLL
jgi:hypothetical protein